LIPAVNTILFCFVPIPEMNGEKRQGNRLTDLLRKPVFYVFILLMVCCGASEMTMSQWASLFAEKSIGVSKVIGDILGPCFFAVLMGLGRLGYGFLGKKLRIVPALFGCSCLTLVCYMITVFGGLPIFSLMGCAVCGLGVSLMWPGILSASSAKYPLAGAPMFAVLALAGDLGCSLGPWLSGVVTDYAGSALGANPAVSENVEQLAMKCGMLAAAVFPLIMVVVLSVYLLIEHRKRKVS
jgi:MFS family permease